MLKQILEENSISIYKLAKDIDEPYSTINDIVNGKVDIADCKAKILKKLSDYLTLPMEEVYQQCCISIEVQSKEFYTTGYITVKHKKYYLNFQYNNRNYEKEICKVTESSSMYIVEAALYEMEKTIKQIVMEEYICSMK